MKKIDFIHTPADWDELHGRIESLTGPGESALATLHAGMAWNMAADVMARAESREARHDTGRPPAELNGYSVIAFAPYRGVSALKNLYPDYLVMVDLTDNEFTPYCVAHWNQHAGTAWNWGNYCRTYSDALRAFMARAGDLSATG